MMLTCWCACYRRRKMLSEICEHHINSPYTIALNISIIYKTNEILIIDLRIDLCIPIKERFRHLSLILN